MSPIDASQIALYDSAPPAIPSDDYTVTVTQTVAIPSTYGTPAPYTHLQDVTVTGPQLGFGPSDLVMGYPPAGSQADWSTVLPHAVLSRPTLPWEVPPEGAAPDGTPWLALLLLSLDSGEVVLPPGAPPGNATGSQTVALADYLTPPGTTTAGPTFDDPTYAQRLETENPGAQAVVVDVDAAAFTAVAPQLKELEYLTHVREVPAGDQAITGTGGGWFSVVVANRLPGRTGGRFAAHLVSLQGFIDNLPGGKTPPTAATMRLLSLASWAFTSLPEGPDFLALMEALDRDGLCIQPAAPPAPQPPQPVADALAKGYVGLPYGTRTGERTTAWYRGPCHPVQMERDLQPLYRGADAALVYDPSTGMFDASFATAWQMGRMLALGNRKFTLALAAWVRENLDAVYLLAERLALFEDGRPAADLLAPDLMRRAATARLAEGLAPHATGSLLGALAPPGDPTRLQNRLERVPGVLEAGELEDLVASGGDPHAAVLARLREEP